MAAAMLLVGGCAVLEPGGGPVDAIVAEAMAAARAPAAEQSAALARAQKEVKRAGTPTAADRLRLATLLATLPAPLRDDARAAELLKPIADASAPGVGRFAALLAAQISERQRLVQELERAARERDRSDKERDKREETLRQSEEAMRQQLEALRAIERDILEREDKLRRKPR
ncbi:MAG: hypothetical protein ACREU1_03365 [Burkholderiales bacterium]